MRAVIAESFERIHRSNLIGMGVLPLAFPVGVTAATLGLRSDEAFTIHLDDDLVPGGPVAVDIDHGDGRVTRVACLCRANTAAETEALRHGGILPKAFRTLLA